MARNDEGLSWREREVMDIVYRLGRATAAEIRAQMAQPPTGPAVRATLRILVRKGRLKHEYDGPRYVYLPTLAPEAARRSAFRHLLDTFFGGSAPGAMAALVEMKDTGLHQSPTAASQGTDRRRRARGEMRWTPSEGSSR